jgi:predicted DNA-binding transcriptional regulator AlpA
MPAKPIVKMHAPAVDAAASNLKPAIYVSGTEASGKRLIRLADLFAQLSVSKATGHRLIAAGKIGPKAIRLTSACVRYDADEIDAWLTTRKPDGDLHDAASWPMIWFQQKRS